MFRDIFAAFGQQFPNWRIRAVMTALIVLMAAIPVFELLVLQIFSTLLVEGPKELAGQGGVVIGLLAVFFIGFAITRGLHHMTKFWRVRVFRAAFAEQQAQTGVGVVGWQWAVAFDVSTYIADLVQVVALAVLLIYLDRVIGAVSAVLLVVVLIQLALLYRRQLRVQRALMDSTVRDVEAPIRERVFSAEFSGVATSIATGVALALVVWRTFTGALLLASAIVLAMALRIFFSRVSSLAPTLMRFARDSLRLERDKGRLTARMAQGGILPTFDDDDEGDVGPDDADASPPAKPVNEKKRAALISRVLLEAQRGDDAAYHSAASRLYDEGPLGENERNALQGASAFLSYATPGPQVGPDPGPIPVFWWPKPMPGSFDEWLDPYLIHASTRRAVEFASLLKPGDVPPHLVLGGSLLSHVHANSIVVGTGVSKLEATVNPDADFVSLRGPLSARVVRRNGGPAIESFGDPRLLARRIHPIGLDATNGRLAFVRNHSDAGIPFVLPEGMDELPIAGSRPEQVVAAITALAGYDGVVTSSVGVAVVCQSYGIPCAVVALGDDPRAKRLDTEFRDHLLGAGLEADWEVNRVEPDLTATDWSARLLRERVSSEKLDEIDAALADALRRHAASLEDELERALGEDQEEDD